MSRVWSHPLVVFSNVGVTDVTSHRLVEKSVHRPGKSGAVNYVVGPWEGEKGLGDPGVLWTGSLFHTAGRPV